MLMPAVHSFRARILTISKRCDLCMIIQCRWETSTRETIQQCNRERLPKKKSKQRWQNHGRCICWFWHIIFHWSMPRPLRRSSQNKLGRVFGRRLCCVRGGFGSGGINKPTCQESPRAHNTKPTSSHRPPAFLFHSPRHCTPGPLRHRAPAYHVLTPHIIAGSAFRKHYRHSVRVRC
jgi:hypothetical protein